MEEVRITRLINNNVVFSQNARGEEIIVFGKAIGFGKKSGDLIENSAIIKIFEAISAKEKKFLSNLVEDINPIYIDVASKIISLFETKLKVKVNDMMLISLSDHLSNAVENKKEGFELPLDILQAVKSIYPQEFLVAKNGIKIVLNDTGVQLSEDEAGYIVLHYINSQGKSFRSDAKYRLRLQEKIINDIEIELKLSLDRNSLYYTRFLTHLSFLAARIHDHELLPCDDTKLYSMFLEQYPRVKNCVEKCIETINEEFDVLINSEEKCYLAIHINNMIKALEREKNNED